MTKVIIVSALGLFLTGCAHHRDVRPQADGIHRVVMQQEDKNQGYRDAMAQANHYCKENGRGSALVVSEGSQYTGDMNEESYKKGKTAARVAKGVGGAAWVFGGKKESDLGGVVGLGGQVADSVLGEGYTYELKFKCQ